MSIPQILNNNNLSWILRETHYEDYCFAIVIDTVKKKKKISANGNKYHIQLLNINSTNNYSYVNKMIASNIH